LFEFILKLEQTFELFLRYFLHYGVAMKAKSHLSMPVSDVQPREKILLIALELFAEQGFERTTVRQIAKKAEVNISAISYYFGDKTGLYHAAFIEPLGSPKDDIALFDNPSLTLEQALVGLFSGFTEPLKQDKLAQLCTRLHMREMVEPTGLWAQEIDNGIAPYHQALLVVLKQHLNLTETDDDLHRLAMCIVAMGVHLFVGREVIEKVCPKIIAGAHALNQTQERLVMFALNMVEAEKNRRKQLDLTH
jgi:TetR/AcrR family transcriptional regulator, regulator of cefoperazone and chloramphenicol sensitivity